jgi:hypothetical protein
VDVYVGEEVLPHEGVVALWVVPRDADILILPNRENSSITFCNTTGAIEVAMRDTNTKATKYRIMLRWKNERKSTHHVEGDDILEGDLE